MTGTVISRITQFFTVRVDERDILCRPRARLLKEKVQILVGDRVQVSDLDPVQGTATIAELEPRRNALPRPAIANVDQVVLVFAAREPLFDPGMLDRFLVLVSRHGLSPVLVCNKTDLEDPVVLAAHLAPYRALGIPLETVSASTGRLAGLPALLSGRISVFAGPSGVGKSSLLNALSPGLSLKAARVSERLERGRHTTTHASLHEIVLPEGLAMVADTPGYTHLSFDDLLPRELGAHFPEMVPHLGGCRFPDCLHRSEPDCAVRQGSALAPSRQSSYERFIGELLEAEERRSSQSIREESAVKHRVGRGGKAVRLVKLDAAVREDSRRVARQRLASMAIDDESDEAPDQVIE
ncbi:MAG: ribosome small subunit-dependent GTPase A [bacterium]|nr:ribosome small subunit-dependent GTPase A [bacterium]